MIIGTHKWSLDVGWEIFNETNNLYLFSLLMKKLNWLEMKPIGRHKQII